MSKMTPVQRWLNDYCDRSDTVSGAVVVTSDGQTQRLRSVAGWPAGAKESMPLLAAAKAAVQRAQPICLIPPVSPNDAEHARIVSLPLSEGERTVGAVALALRSANDSTAKAFINHLRTSGSSLVTALGDNEKATIVDTLEASRLMQIQATLLGHATLVDAATALVSELAAALKFDRVSIGLLEGNKASLLALSHSAEFQQGLSLPRLLGAAMEEAIDQRCTVVHPQPPGDKPKVVIAHADLSARAGTIPCTVPLMHEGRTVGALCFERAAGNEPAPSEIALCEHIACLVAPLVELRIRAERSAWQRAADSLKRRSGPLKMTLIAVAVAAATLALVPVDYRVGAPAHLEGAVQRVIAAPTDGFLQKAHVRPGDSVKAGDLLAELVDQDLLLEQRRWESELAQHQNAYTAALARSDRAQFAVRQAKAAEAQAQLDLVRSQLERTRLVAPIDGLVINGDLTQSPGAPVKRGDVLLTLAPDGQFRLIVDVDERDIGDIKVGATGGLALSSLPGNVLAIRVERVTPVAVAKDGRNAFEVEARFDGAPALLRPGMQGVARIEAGSRSLGWVLTHRIADWLRLLAWSWTG